MDAQLPYPLPGDWRLRAARPMRRWAAIVLPAVVVLASGLALWFLVATDGGPSLGLMVVITGVGLVGGIGFERAGAERGLPRFVNAVTLGEATAQPADSWVHLFRETGPGRWLSTWFLWVGVVDTVITVGLIVKAFLPGGHPSMLLVFVPVLLVSLILLACGVAPVMWRYQQGSFARSPLGIALGEHGVLDLPQRPERMWEWGVLASVTALPGLIDRDTGDFEPRVAVAFADGREPAELSLSGYESHAWLIYTALRFYLEHPSLREELGTTFAQQRITAWRDAMFVGDRVADALS